MTTFIRGDCDSCGIVETAVTACRLALVGHVYPEPVVRFACPSCRGLVQIVVSPDEYRQLRIMGVRLTPVPLTDVEVDDIAAQLAYATAAQILEEMTP